MKKLRPTGLVKECDSSRGNGNRSRLLVVFPFLLLFFFSTGPASQQDSERNPISPLAIQPPAEELLDYQGFLRELGELAVSPRVRIEEIGRTWQGRSIYQIVVARAAVIADLETYRLRAARIATPEIAFKTLSKVEIQEKEVDRLIGDTPLPVLFAGASWGHEAAQVEGLLKAARTLAFEESEVVRSALAHSIAIFIPLMNPDGREVALEEWKKEPLARGNSGVGNAFEFMLNRDFIHATQPESVAIVETSLRWRPVAAIDQHEDMYHLGVALPEVCFVEPFAEGFDVEEHPLTRRAIVAVGGAIAGQWRSLGFRALYNPQGDNTFAPLPEPGQGISPVAGSAGRLNLMWSLHGIAGFITESARSPGTQTWQDRVEQKASAALAALQEVSGNPSLYAEAVYRRKMEEMGGASSEFVTVPLDSGSAGALSELLRILKLHRIQAFRVSSPYAALVIPMGQAEGNMARHLLIGERSRLNLLGPGLGLKFISSADLSEEERSRFQEATLWPASAPLPEANPSAAKMWRVSPSVEGYRLINTLLSDGRSSQVGTYQNSFLVSGSRRLLSLAAGSWQIPLEAVTGVRPQQLSHLSLPVVGVYAGQGVNRADWGEVVWALKQARFPFRILDQQNVQESLKEIDALIVPSGSAPEIVNGWSPEPKGPRQHWKLPVESKGIGDDGLEAIRSWVRSGGTYIGIGSGGGLLAGQGMLSLTEAEMPDSRVGIGIVRLRLDQPNSPLLRGFSSESLAAFIDAPPGQPQGGFIFRSEANAGVASYAGIDTVEGEKSFLSNEPFSERDTAILIERHGEGRLVLMGINPTFRGQWRNTFPLLYNAIYLSIE